MPRSFCGCIGLFVLVSCAVSFAAGVEKPIEVKAKPSITWISDLDAGLKTAKDEGRPIVMDFWAVWCGPCSAFAPIFEKLQQEYYHDFIFAKVNVDENPKTPAKYGVRGIPTLILFNQGKEVDKVVGMTSKDNLEKMLAGV